MTCVVCKTGNYEEGFTTVVLTKGDSVAVIKRVPALICDQCGEYILSGEISKIVLSMAQEAFSKGAEVEVRQFVA